MCLENLGELLAPQRPATECLDRGRTRLFKAPRHAPIGRVELRYQPPLVESHRLRQVPERPEVGGRDDVLCHAIEAGPSDGATGEGMSEGVRVEAGDPA